MSNARPDPQEWFSVEEFVVHAKRRGAPVSRGATYDAIRRGVLPHVRIGRRIAVPADALERLLAIRSGSAPDGERPAV